MAWTIFVMAAALAAQPAAGEPQPQASSELARNVLPITQGPEGQYGGAGWERLIADGAAAQYFLIGEQHATADIAHFGTAVHKALAARGYTHAAYEVGPYSMDHAERLVRSGKGRLAEFIRQPGYSFVLPFLFFQEEVDLAEQIVAASPDKQDALWGLDQEFVGATPIAVELLRGWARTPAQHAAVDALAAKGKANTQLIGAANWSEFAPVETAFSDNATARDLIAALKLSNEIYAPFTGRGGTGYDGNLRRETYMKTNFAARFAEAERRTGRAPKVFLKFGGYHAQRGISGTNVPSLGNFLAEWGLPRGFRLVNVMAECVGGEMINPASGKPAPCAPYFSTDSAIAKLPKTNPLTLIDLRPMRPLLRRMTGLDEETRRLILSFDYYLAIKDVKPATLVAQPPKP